RGRKAHFDFLEADLHELLEQAELALYAHGLDQRLVAIAQVGAHPDGRLCDALAGPGSFGEVARKGDERTVFVSGIRNHDAPVSISGYDAVAEPVFRRLSEREVAGMRLPNCHGTLGPATDRQ